MPNPNLTNDCMFSLSGVLLWFKLLPKFWRCRTVDLSGISEQLLRPDVQVSTEDVRTIKHTGTVAKTVQEHIYFFHDINQVL